MPNHFDPYRKWLGIPEKDQPPHHYRLLNIEPFEEDPDVIANAVDARSAQLKRHQSGEHSSAAKNLLNEITEAQICLLNGKKKAAYDGQLSSQLNLGSGKPLPMAVPLSAGAGPADYMSAAGVPNFDSSSVASHASDRSERKQKQQVMLLVVGAVAVVAILVGLGLYQLTRSNGTSVVERPRTAQPANNAATGQPTNDRDTGQPPAKTAKGLPVTPDPTPPKTTGQASTPEGMDNSVAGLFGLDKPEPSLGALIGNETDPAGPGELTATPEPVEAGPTAVAALPKPSEPSSPGETPEPPAERHAVPDGATQQKIQDDVMEILKEDLAKATTPEGKKATAQALYDQAEANKSDPNARFVLLRMGCGMAAEAGDVAKAMEMVGLMEKEYKIKPAGVQAYVLKKAADSLPVGPAGLIVGEQIVDTATALAEEYAAADDYGAATGFSELAIAAARKTKDTSLIRPTAISDREIKKKKKGFALTKKAFETLASNPNDPAANLTAGRYQCFRRNDWAKGIPLLAKGSDPELAALAQKESAAPTDGTLVMALGDGWFEQAEKAKEENQLALRSRAKFHYEQALPSLEGLQKVKVKKRVEAIAEAVATAESKETKKPAIVRGVVEEGNVALASRGTTVTGPASGGSYLLDGSITNGYSAYSTHPCEWTITFPKVYRLKAIGFKLKGGKDSPYSYRYAVAASADGEKYFPLMDCSKDDWMAGWQRVAIPNRPIKSVKLYGLHYSGDSYFYAEEFQAYCIIPR